MTYSLAGNELTTATIFASLQLFNVIQFPMQVLPTVFSFLSDGHVAIVRISRILKAEELPHEVIVRTEQENAIDASGDFAFETIEAPDHSDKQVLSGDLNREEDEEHSGPEHSSAATLLRDAVANGKQTGHFTLNDIDLHIPRGSFVCIFGQIGSGKSALLQALIGEMKQTRGLVTFGGSVSLVTQHPWIQNTSVRDNILFGQSMNEDRLERVVQACALSRDLELFSDGINTEIGGEFVLTGRVYLIRVAYYTVQ
jgi:ATP-binding cassette subfamily C (CFTR/MRP) protein 1